MNAATHAILLTAIALSAALLLNDWLQALRHKERREVWQPPEEM